MYIEQKGFKRSTLSACYRAFFMRNSLHIGQTIHVISTMTIVCAVPGYIMNKLFFQVYKIMSLKLNSSKTCSAEKKFY